MAVESPLTAGQFHGLQASSDLPQWFGVPGYDALWPGTVEMRFEHVPPLSNNTFFRVVQR